MSPKDSTIQLIQKLFAKAESARAIGSAEEAATFAAKASELLLRHKLEMTDLEVKTEDVEDFIDSVYFDPVRAGATTSRSRNKQQGWMTLLAQALADAHFCDVITINGMKVLHVVGRRSDILIMTYLFTVLCREGERLALAYYYEQNRLARQRGEPMPRQTQRAFRLGFVQAIRTRLRAMRQQVQQQGGQHALVRFQAAEQAVVKFMEDLRKKDKNIKNVRPQGLDTRNRDGIEAGRKAGKKVNLHAHAVTPGAPANKGTLAAGQRLLGGGK